MSVPISSLSSKPRVSFECFRHILFFSTKKFSFILLFFLVPHAWTFHSHKRGGRKHKNPYIFRRLRLEFNFDTLGTKTGIKWIFKLIFEIYFYVLKMSRIFFFSCRQLLWQQQAPQNQSSKFVNHPISDIITRRFSFWSSVNLEDYGRYWFSIRFLVQ